MNRAKYTQNFEQNLLSYTDLCYSVALALTRNPYDAEDLARDVMTRIWLLRHYNSAKTVTKKELLMQLRERFLQKYRPKVASGAQNASNPLRIRTWEPDKHAVPTSEHTDSYKTQVSLCG